jgi:hypothetical protein
MNGTMMKVNYFLGAAEFSVAVVLGKRRCAFDAIYDTLFRKS